MDRSSFYTTDDRILRMGDRTHRKYAEDRKPEGEFEYSRRVPVGRVAKVPSLEYVDNQTDLAVGDVLYLELEGSDRIGIFGRSGSGKTTLLKTLVSRMFKGGMGFVHFSDVKNDFHDIDNKGGVSKELARQMGGLLPGEQRQPIPKEMYGPMPLCRQYTKSPPSYVTWFSLRFEDVTEYEFEQLVPTTSPTQESVLHDLMAAVPVPEMSYDKIFDYLDPDELDYPKGAVEAVERAIRTVKKQNIIVDNDRDDADPIAAAGENVVALSMKHFKNVDRETLELFVTALMRKIREYVDRGVLQPPICIVFDEAHFFLGKKSVGMVAQELADYIDTFAREHDIPAVISTQKPKQLPDESPDILGGLTHYIMAKNLPDSQWKAVLHSTNLWREHGNRDEWRDLFDWMDQYQFLVIIGSGSDNEFVVVDPLPPLCTHPVED